MLYRYGFHFVVFHSLKSFEKNDINNTKDYIKSFVYALLYEFMTYVIYFENIKNIFI